ncbi:MAG TPA: hypothetical protein VIH90_03570 [Candidatus Saccharimonadales bacterium]
MNNSSFGRIDAIIISLVDLVICSVGYFFYNANVSNNGHQVSLTSETTAQETTSRSPTVSQMATPAPTNVNSMHLTTDNGF